MLRGLARSGRRMLHVESAGCVFDVGAAAHPHPRKAAAGLPGEDAYFIASRQAGQVALGVGDGVGGAGDSGRFSRDLMEQAEGAYSSAEYAVSADAHPFEPRAILDLAYARTRDRVEGRSTACVCVLDGSARADGAPVLRAANLGDSGYWLLRPHVDMRTGKRRWRVAHKSRAQQHGYNYPYQLGMIGGAEVNVPTDAELAEVELHAGDVVLAATDGLFDILFPLEILELAAEALHREATAAAVAACLVGTTVERSFDDTRSSPRVVSMAEQGLVARLREAQDDVTVVVAKVLSRAAAPP